jgi:hypothetical protein
VHVQVLKMTIRRSSLLRFLGPAYDWRIMRPKSGLPLIAAAVVAMGCANQTGATDRQLREQEVGIKRLSANSDRLEERILALEAAMRSGRDPDRGPQDPGAARPELPVVRVVPSGQKAEDAADTEQPSEGDSDDTRRLVIVGEGSRVEARAATEKNNPSGGRQTPPANSRARKGNQGSFSPASTSGEPK